jgi:hypothetical protein
MRQAANNAGVSWEMQKVSYKKDGVGFTNGGKSDANLIQSEIESILGFKPVIIDEPAMDSQVEQTQ